MIQRLINLYSKHFLSRWTILFMDTITIVVAFVLSYFIRFNFNYLEISQIELLQHLSFVTVVYFISFLITRSYTGIVRHTALSDVFRILKASGISFAVLIVSNFILFFTLKESIYIIPNSILIIQFLCSVFFLVGVRVIVKLFFLEASRQFSKVKTPVIIYGAGASGMITKNALIKDQFIRYEIVAYIDDNISLVGKRLEGIPILNFEQGLSKSFVDQYNVKQLIISIQDIKPEKKKKIVELGLELQLEVKVVPTVDKWMNGELSSKQLRNVRIEELLERDIIELDNKNISQELKNKIIMITGGAGSIGSEIARQVLNYSPKRLIILDQAESPIYDLQFEINNAPSFQNILNRVEFVIASVKDKFRMNKIFELYQPDIIYHAAAYKHVPLMENNPYEALMVNIIGTKNIADLSIKHKTEKFIMISTDKAVNPTNIMGASKRIAEMYIQSIDSSITKFITTRFGNVLGSNGSVVPLFRKQIAEGGPITLTHKDITRYFMTIPEACNLVLEAGSMGEGSDIFIFDMGSPVKISDLAKKMIRLYGFKDDEIEIKEIGLRPGEKLYEELLANKENNLPTHHPKIMRAKVASIPNGEVNKLILDLSRLVVDSDDFAIVAKMKQMVPEFKSNNSVFEKLDH